MNVVVLVGKVADRPFRPSGRERVVVKLDVAGDRRPDKPDRIEVHCFGDTANHAETKVNLGDIVTVHGRLEQRVGKDDMGEFEELRVVADHITVVSGSGRPQRPAGRFEARTDEVCDGIACADNQTAHGVVKLFRTREQFGFIEVPNTEQDVFFHIRDIHEGIQPEHGDEVRFELIQGDRGPAARHVTIES
jgi:cold shock CspA family protein/single-stranded DNA-binding protein